MGRESVLVIQMQVVTGTWIDVGYLNNRDEKNWFRFDESYWARADRPVLGQIFEEQGRAWQPNAHVALPRWLSHLLPEGGVRDAVARAARVSKNREFELIRRLGSTDLPGAIRAVVPSQRVPSWSIPAHADEADGAEEDPLLKFSLAGAQLKFSVYGNERGLAVPIRGRAGNYIVKFPDGRPGFGGVPQAELGALELAQAIGIDTPKAMLIDPSTVTGLEEWARRVSGSALAIGDLIVAQRMGESIWKSWRRYSVFRLGESGRSTGAQILKPSRSSSRRLPASVALPRLLTASSSMC
jgi:serine/threonine-protein kinase HipA